jgi:hypothetical protein
MTPQAPRWARLDRGGPEPRGEDPVLCEGESLPLHVPEDRDARLEAGEAFDLGGDQVGNPAEAGNPPPSTG